MCLEKEDQQQSKQYVLLDDIFPQNQLSSYYMNNGDYETAIGYINDGLQSGDDLFIDKLQYNQVVYYEKKHDFNKAYELMNELYKNYADNVEFKAEYDYLYTRVNINPNPVNSIEEDEE